jgi:hypothetical protein
MFHVEHFFWITEAFGALRLLKAGCHPAENTPGFGMTSAGVSQD